MEQQRSNGYDESEYKILSNPPFGREWKNEQAAVKREAALGYAGQQFRFPGFAKDAACSNSSNKVDES